MKSFAFRYVAQTVVFCSGQCDIREYGRIAEEFMEPDPPSTGTRHISYNPVFGFIDYLSPSGLRLIATLIDIPEDSPSSDPRKGPL